jgi:integrase
MALSDTKLKNLKPKDKIYQVADESGLLMEVTPKGTKVWRLRYRLFGKQEKVMLGHYPAYGLAEARSWRDECKVLIKRGLSPMALKRADEIPEHHSPTVRELAEGFISKWCMETVEKSRQKEAEKQADSTVIAFATKWYEEIVKPNNKRHAGTWRVLNKDVFPAIGSMQVEEVTVNDILSITDAIKNRGSDQMALQTRNILKRMFSYAMTRQKTQFNPAAAIEGKYIAQARSRDVALASDEIGRLLRAIYQSGMRRANKLALHLLVLTMVRKTQLTEASWDEIDFDKAEWLIPAERMKKDKAQIVPLADQALEMLKELKQLSSGSDWVFPSRNYLNRHISDTTLNAAIRTLDLDIRQFVIHDFRRTASTHLHEAGFNSDWIEKCLAHETKGIRGVYNKAQYADQRRQMLQWWADFVDAQIEEGRKVIIGRFGTHRA